MQSIIKQIGEIGEGATPNSLKRYIMKDGILCRQVPGFDSTQDFAKETSLEKANTSQLFCRGPSNDVAVQNNSGNTLCRGPSVDEAVQSGGSVNVLSHEKADLIVPIVPDSIKYEIISMFHDPPEMGHMGVKKTKLAIKRRFFWAKMNTDIHSYVKQCITCQKYKTETLKKKGLLGEVPYAKQIFETVYIDFCGPYPRSKMGNRFIFVLIDQLSGWPEFYAMPTSKARKTCEFLDEIFARFGPPSIFDIR